MPTNVLLSPTRHKREDSIKDFSKDLTKLGSSRFATEKCIIVKYFDSEGETKEMAERNNLLRRKIDNIKSNIVTIHNKFESLLKGSQSGEEQLNHYNNHLWASPERTTEKMSKHHQKWFWRLPPVVFITCTAIKYFFNCFPGLQIQISFDLFGIVQIFPN